MADQEKGLSVGAASIAAFTNGASISETMNVARAVESGEDPFAEPSDSILDEGADTPYAESHLDDTPKSSTKSLDIKPQLDMAVESVAGYKETLRRLNLTEDEAFKIIDTIMIQNKRYRESMRLLSGRLTVVFQTQTVDDIDMLEEIMESKKPMFKSSIDQTTWRHILAASIVQYGRRSFPGSTAEDYTARANWVSSLHAPVYDMLVQELRQFHSKVQVLITRNMLRHF